MNELPQQGSFVLSIDTELGWGGVHNGSSPRRTSQYERTREAIGRLLALMQRYEIRATWAVVGHLFLEQCQATDGVKHPEITRPFYPWFRGDWFNADPCSDLQKDPFWYGADLVKQIQSCKVPQEIGSHGFSHMIVGDPGCSQECFDSELRACLEQASKRDVDLKSFVFPRNSVGHLDVLAEKGFTAFRGPVSAWYTKLPPPSRPWARLVDSILPLTPPVTFPGWQGALCNLPASYFYPHRDGWAKLIPLGLGVHKAKLGLERAAKRNGLFHMWFHAFNLASDLDGLLRGLETIFLRVNKLRETGYLLNPSMADLAASLQPAGREVN